ncbi:hypothetical protein AMTRI_Chr08g205520 [Amborella trichopoda]
MCHMVLMHEERESKYEREEEAPLDHQTPLMLSSALNPSALTRSRSQCVSVHPRSSARSSICTRSSALIHSCVTVHITASTLDHPPSPCTSVHSRHRLASTQQLPRKSLDPYTRIILSKILKHKAVIYFLCTPKTTSVCKMFNTIQVNTQEDLPFLKILLYLSQICTENYLRVSKLTHNTI